MRALITGAGGTVGRAVVADWRARGADVVAWDRERAAPDDYWAMDAYIQAVDPDVLLHLAIASRPTGRANEAWVVNHDWPGELAWICRERAVRFLHTSTVMVWDAPTDGPIPRDREPTAAGGYGFEKRRAEGRVWQQNPHATIARLSWQIGHDQAGNQMRAWLAERLVDGVVGASSRWYPACAFLDDTAAGLWRLLYRPPGLYQLDSNRGWTMHQIATAIGAEEGWTVVVDDDLVQDQRMAEERVPLRSLRERLPALPALGE